jgi:hypothetical protein
VTVSNRNIYRVCLFDGCVKYKYSRSIVLDIPISHYGPVTVQSIIIIIISSSSSSSSSSSITCVFPGKKSLRKTWRISNGKTETVLKKLLWG